MAISPAVWAEGRGIPRTPAGRPDFTGVWRTNFMLAPLERPAGVTSLIVTEEEARRLAEEARTRRRSGLPTVYDPREEDEIDFAMPRVAGQWRSSLIVDPPDGKAPMTPAARQLVRQQAESTRAHRDGDVLADGPEAVGLTARCLGGPGRSPFTFSPLEVLRQFVQTSNSLVTYTEGLWGETRLIGIGARPRPTALVSFDGDSVGRWDGDTLVVETSGMRTDPPVRPGGAVIQNGARVRETLRLTSPDTLLYSFTVIDPLSYDAAWRAEFELERSQARVFEAACHEGNYSLPGVLRGAREAEARAVADSREPAQ